MKGKGEVDCLWLEEEEGEAGGCGGVAGLKVVVEEEVVMEEEVVEKVAVQVDG